MDYLAMQIEAVNQALHIIFGPRPSDLEDEVTEGMLEEWKIHRAEERNL